MPRYAVRGRVLVGRKMRGRGKFIDWVKNAGQKVNSWLKGSKAISRAGDFALKSGFVPQQYQALLSNAVDIARTNGYGRRGRVYRGRGIGLAGGALRLAGARMY